MKSEKNTRKEIIDQRLTQAGWNISDRTQVVEEYDIIVNEHLANDAIQAIEEKIKFNKRKNK